jgi:hypothetical protein
MKLAPKLTMTAAAVALSLIALGACTKHLQAPLDRGVCYHVAFDKSGKARFNRVAENMPNMENCAAQLEGMRVRFARMGAYQNEVVGAYQGVFIFVKPNGIFSAKTYESVQYLALVRTGDGRLVIPGAMPNY